jgi:hypothetical protein
VRAFVTIRGGDDALEDAAILLDGLDGSDGVIVTRWNHIVPWLRAIDQLKHAA